jgi:peptide-methionine (S)-S-oxide reductase
MTTLPAPVFDPPAADDVTEATLVLAGGCFWCVEAVFLRLAGVLGVRSGYAGDTAATANYEAVCSGRTNQAEVVEVRYDPRRLSLGQVLHVFFSVAHDPTQLNRQGNDVGRQYRSAIFYATPEQQATAEAYIAQLNDAGAFPRPVVTTLEPLEAFHEAEPYHQNYAALHPGQPYITFTALPKVDALSAAFPSLVK